MAFKPRTRIAQESGQPHLSEFESAIDAPPVASDGSNVLVSYGIHRGRFPVGGMTISAAREVLQRLINIDESAVAVINGVPVDESETISQDVSMLSFVKPSSLKG